MQKRHGDHCARPAEDGAPEIQLDAKHEKGRLVLRCRACKEEVRPK